MRIQHTWTDKSKANSSLPKWLRGTAHFSSSTVCHPWQYWKTSNPIHPNTYKWAVHSNSQELASHPAYTIIRSSLLSIIDFVEIGIAESICLTSCSTFYRPQMLLLVQIMCAKQCSVLFVCQVCWSISVMPGQDRAHFRRVFSGINEYLHFFLIIKKHRRLQWLIYFIVEYFLYISGLKYDIINILMEELLVIRKS